MASVLVENRSNYSVALAGTVIGARRSKVYDLSLIEGNPTYKNELTVLERTGKIVVAPIGVSGAMQEGERFVLPRPELVTSGNNTSGTGAHAPRELVSLPLISSSVYSVELLVSLSGTGAGALYIGVPGNSAATDSLRFGHSATSRSEKRVTLVLNPASRDIWYRVETYTGNVQHTIKLVSWSNKLLIL